MDRRSRWVLVFGSLVVLVIAGYFMLFVKEYGSLPSVSGSLSASPSTVSRGGSFTLNLSVSSYSISSPGYSCIPFGSFDTTYYSGGGWCGDSYCVTPCRWRDKPAAQSWDGYQVLMCDGSRCNMPSWSGDYPTVYGPSNDTLWYMLGDSSSSPSRFSGFHLPPGTQLRIRVSADHSGGSSTYGWPVVGVCYNGGSIGYSIDHGSYYKSWSTTYKGISWSCVLFKAGSADDDYVAFRVYVDQGVQFAVVMGGVGSFESGDESGDVYWATDFKGISVTVSRVGSGIYMTAYGGSGISCSGSVGATNVTDRYTTTSWTSSWSCSVSSSASAGSHTVRVELEDHIPEYFQAMYYPSVMYLDSDYLVKSFSTTVQVVAPATDVSLSGVRQEPDDSAVEGTITVSGGTLFDYVKVYIDGVSVATVNKSSFSCGSSSCTYSFNYSMYGKSDGSHTVKAELYVDGSLKDSATSSFNYYQIGVRNVSATQGGVSFEAKGGYKYVRVYVDSTSCIAKDWTLHSPSSSHNWASDSVTYSWPSCAASEGTHTVYVQLKDESSHTVSDSGTVTVSFHYSLSNPQPPQGTRYYVGVQSKWTVPSSFSIPTSISYSTDAPNATLKEYFAGSEVKSQPVSGSGTFQYTIPGSQIGSGCGTGKIISWSLGSASAQTTVDIYCIYGKVVSPGTTVTLPSTDNQHVMDGSTITVEVEASSNPSGPTLTPRVTVDGQQGTPTSCGAGSSNYCYVFDASGWSCGSTHSVNLSIDADGNPNVVSDTASFTVNCALNYVEIASPSDGSTFHIYQPVQDVQLQLSVNWASDDPGAYLRVWFNGAYRDDLVTASDCSATTCYVLDYQHGLQVGSNEVRVDLYNSSGQKVAEDSVTFTVNYWRFSFGEDWTASPPVVYLTDAGDPSHADYCQYDLNGETGMMNWNPTEVRWEVPVTDDDVGKTIRVSCYYGSDVVFEGNYEIQGSGGGQPGTPVNITIGGGGTAVKVSSFPIFPRYDRSGPYLYSVYVHKGISAGSVYKDVYISNGYLCFIPKRGSHLLKYYSSDFRAFPTSENDVDQIIGSLRESDLRSAHVIQQGSAQCVQLKGTAVIEDLVDNGSTGDYYFIVLDTQQSTLNMNVVVVGVIAAMLVGYILYQRGVFGGV